MTDPLGPAEGFLASELAAEFPGLRLRWLTVEARQRASPRSLVRRVRGLSDRYRGMSVVAMRTHAIPQAYRSFFRQIGLDPDTRRIPSEEVAVARLLHGGFRSVDLISDACLVALVETGVPVWALDADVVGEGGLGLRIVSGRDREAAASTGAFLDPDTLVVADARSVHAQLFEPPLPDHGVSPATRRVALFSIAVEGVPEIHVEEALWMAAELLEPSD
jgi:DNA/RNA-binding domain of Phe-tRNA-synthetase-like protein